MINGYGFSMGKILIRKAYSDTLFEKQADFVYNKRGRVLWLAVVMAFRLFVFQVFKTFDFGILSDLPHTHLRLL